MINNEFKYVYLVKFDGDINGLVLQKEEVADIYFFPIEKLENDFKHNNGKYTPHGDYWFEVIQEIKSRIRSI